MLGINVDQGGSVEAQNQWRDEYTLSNIQFIADALLAFKISMEYPARY